MTPYRLGLGLLLFLLAACGDDAATTAAPPEPLPFEHESVGSNQTLADLEASRRKSYTETIPGTDQTFQMVWVPNAGFWIGKTEVTWDEYELYALGEETPEGVDAVARPSKPYHPYDRGWGTGDRPACGMTRAAAEAYCRWLSRRTGKTYQLPSGRQWEAVYEPWASRTKPLRRRAWFKTNSGETTHPVATLAPNRLGIHDLLGNVMEYTTDTSPEDENGDTWPILRGGSFADEESVVNGTHRQPQLFAWHEREPQRPRSRWWLCDGPYTGFRVIRLAPEAEARSGSSR